MFFALCIREHPTALRADLQRYYFMNLDELGSKFTIWQASACAVCLPPGSKLMGEIDERLSWSITDILIHNLYDFFAHKHVPFPWENAHDHQNNLPEFEALPLDEFQEWYANATSTYKEVENWQTL